MVEKISVNEKEKTKEAGESNKIQEIEDEELVPKDVMNANVVETSEKNHLEEAIVEENSEVVVEDESQEKLDKSSRQKNHRIQSLNMMMDLNILRMRNPLEETKV